MVTVKTNAAEPLVHDPAEGAGHEVGLIRCHLVAGALLFDPFDDGRDKGVDVGVGADPDRVHEAGAEEEAAASLRRMDAAARVTLGIMLNAENKAEVRLAAIGRLIDVERRRANLLGMDAPKAINIRGEFKVITVDELSQALAELESELGHGVGDAGRVVEARAVAVAASEEAGSGG